MQQKLLLLVLLHKIRDRNSRRKKWSVRPLNQDRKKNSEYYRLVQRLDMDAEQYYKYFRMTEVGFEELLEFVRKNITVIAIQKLRLRCYTMQMQCNAMQL